jgi:hypothetical protein
MSYRNRLLAAMCVSALCLAPLSIPATTITVTNTNDSGAGSLRQALADANDGDTINFAVTGTIGLTSAELSVDKNITISGPGADSLAVNANYHRRVFNIRPGANVTISRLTMTGGDIRVSLGNGGGILNDHGTLELTNCAVEGNAAGYGGGIYNDGRKGSVTLTLLNSTVTDNIATDVTWAYGGGIYNNAQDGSAVLTIISSTISSNSAIGADIMPGALGFAGGIYNYGGTLMITNSTISGNHAGGGFQAITGLGGGIYNDGTVAITNSTVSHNTAAGNDGVGGGISNPGMLMIESSILSYNVAQNGANLSGAVISHGYNVCSDLCGGYFNGPGDQINTDPLLGPLQNNGGPTFTRALLPGSPAMDAGNPTFIPPPWYDQRGPDFWRVRNGRIDIGSFEVQEGPAVTPTPTPTATPTATPQPRPTRTPRPRPSPIHPPPTPQPPR